MSNKKNPLKKHIENKKFILIFLFWLLFFVWRSSVFFHPSSSPESGIIEGMAFASHHGYQRGIKVHLTRSEQSRIKPDEARRLAAYGDDFVLRQRLYPTDKKQQEFIFPLSYSGTFKAYNIPPGEYQIVFVKHGYRSEVRNTTVQASKETKIPPVTLKRSLGSDYFYHFVHTLNIFAFSFLLITGIGTYYLRHGDRVGKAFLRFCLIMSFCSLRSVVYKKP